MEFYDSYTAAKRLGVSVQTVRRMCRKQQIASERDPINHQWWVVREEVDKLASMRNQGGNDERG